MTVLVGLTIVLFSAFIARSIAKSKHRSGAGWFIAGLLFGPLALLVALLPSAEQTQACPFCHEPVKLQASVCPHCRRDLPQTQTAELTT